MTETLRQARLFAEYALLELLPRVRIEKREALRRRIAAVRAGQADHLPEVVAARLALESMQGAPSP